MKNFDVLIVGGGASGSTLAIMLARQNKSVCVVDCNEVPAKKLLVTGNGRCNITNTKLNSDFYNQNIDSFLKNFDIDKTIEFFKSIGIFVYADSEGRCYPVSNTAKSVVHAIKNQFDKLGITFVNDYVVDIKQEKDFVITTKNNHFFAKQVVIANGNTSTSFLNNFDINIKHLCPSLVALKTKQNTKRLQGIRLSDVSVTAKCSDTTKQQFGEVLFKQEGLSGICIFNLSTIFARNKNFVGSVVIDIFPNKSEKEIIDMLQNNKTVFAKAIDMLQALLNKEVALEILKRTNLSIDVPCSQIYDTTIKNIAKTIKNLKYDIVGAYDNNQVVSGGVKLEDLTNTLEHKNHKGLYFCGEVCDVDAECGGYNLQWAFCSAKAVCNGIIKK